VTTEGTDRARRIEPLGEPVSATVRLPGSKSLTNRALVSAALARGTSTLTGALHADDTEAMAGCLASLGVSVRPEWEADRIVVDGCRGVPPATEAALDARYSGTTSRFVLPVAALGAGRYRLDGSAQLRGRPLGPALTALRRLGVTAEDLGAPGHLPVLVRDGPMTGGAVELPGDTSSQFLSGLLLAGAAARDGLVVRVTTELVSRPYVDMTVAVMRAFGGSVEQPDPSTWLVAPTGYDAAQYAVEPDASAASYFFAAAAICGGSVTVEGLGTGSLQGDLRFVDVLEQMGARVTRSAERTTVSGTGSLDGVEVDMADFSDTVPTLAVVAVFAATPTRIRGVGFIRHKESDRIGDVVTELRRCGIEATEEPDGFVVRPATPGPATIQTYDDHRMAMSFALLGLRAEGISIADPGCVAKTFPGFWEALDGLRSGSDRSPAPGH
jgi:3-phosphoshikimate 1-carboxyvinyltransferase